MSSSFIEYPDEELNDAKTNNVIAFSVILGATILLLSLILTMMGCILLGFRRNSYTVSRTKRKIKQEIKKFNLKSSTVLAKNQKSLRYLASHPHYEDKFMMLSYVPEKKINEETEELIEETKLTEDLENSKESLQGSQEVTEGLEDSQQSTRGLEESIKESEPPLPPPEYIYPKYLIASTQKQPEQPPPDYEYPKLITEKF